MTEIMSAVSSMVFSARMWTGQFLRLFFIWEVPSGGGVEEITGMSFLGIFCIVLPLVGLGIGIIRRLVKIRA